MKYDFDNTPERRGTGCFKWDEAPEGVIPLWVADMDFKAAPFIMDALRRRLEHGVFGYTKVLEDYYQAVVDWFGHRRGWKIERDWIMYVPGVIPAIACTLKAFTRPGDKVAVHAPAYNHFYTSIRNARCQLVENHLLREGDSFVIDFEQMERQLSDPQVKIFLLCNPHNPTGRVWTADELRRVGEICRKTDTMLVSDEIHCEIEMPGHRFTPFAVACPDVPYIAFNSPSKNFNLAGLQISNIICPDSAWRSKLDRAINDNEVCDVNPFGVEALKAAYTPEGEEWLRQMNEYVWENYVMLRDRVKADLGWTVCALQGTYLAWLDCEAAPVDTETIQRELTEVEKVWINAGGMYGDSRYMRINLATSHSVFSEALERMVSGLKRICGKA